MGKPTPDYIRDKLLWLGFTPANKGFNYLIDAVMILERDPDAAFNVVKKIYMELGSKYGVSSQAAERCIRQSILSAMKLSYEKIHDYLRCQPTAASGSYKNSDFLLAFHIALHRE